MMISGSTLLKSAILTASLAVLFVAGAVAAYAGEPNIEQCLDPEICPIPYVRLAKQETEPFLFLGNVVDVNHPRYKAYNRYKNALRSFPDVRSCLTEEERGKSQPDLRQMDWGAIGNIREIEVCVFRIASSIEDIETIILWLRHHGFEVREMQRRMSDTYVPRYETESIFNLESFLAIEKFRKIIPRVWLARIIGLEWGTSYALTMSFSQKYQLVGVRSRMRTITQE